MNYVNPWVAEAIKLDPAAYVSDPVVHALAMIVSAEVEIERAATRAVEAQSRQREGKPLPRDDAVGANERRVHGLLGNLHDPPPYWVDQTPWCELAMLPAVIDRCAKRAHVKPAAMALAIGEIFRPRNWMTFYWLGRYLQQTNQTLAVLDAAIRRHETADTAAIERYLAAKGKAAGAASGKARSHKREASKRDVVARRAKLLSGTRPTAAHAIVGKIAAQTGKDKGYIRELLKEHDEEMKG